MLKHPSWRERFPGLSDLSPKTTAMLDKRARTICLKQGTVIFGPGKPAENLFLLVSGTVRVQRLSETGCKIVLHRVHAGESCVLTMACLLAFEYGSAEGLAETDIETVVIPRSAFDEMMGASRIFRAFVFEAYSKRVTDLFLLIEDMAYKVNIRRGPRLCSLDVLCCGFPVPR